MQQSGPKDELQGTLGPMGVFAIGVVIALVLVDVHDFVNRRAHR